MQGTGDRSFGPPAPCFLPPAPYPPTQLVQECQTLCSIFVDTSIMRTVPLKRSLGAHLPLP